jgi:putative copper export protein
LIGFGSVLLVAHLLVWLRGISAIGGFTTSFIGSVLDSTPGRLELLRVVLALLTVLSGAVTRRGMLGVLLGVACLAVSGAVGHPAGIEPIWTIPSKAVHLIAGAAWLGGLLWLLTGVRRDDANFPFEAKRVSTIALVSVIAILLSGTIQVRFFLSQWSDLVDSTYGRLALIKFVGLLVLIGLGAFNRFLLLPAVQDAAARPALKRTVRQEIALIAVLVIIGGFLAYIPTPTPPRSAAVITNH